MELGDSHLYPVQLLGKGGFGQVFLCRAKRHERNQFVCVKRIMVRNPKSEIKLIMDEIYIVSQLNHPNIVHFIRSFVYDGSINIVMEYASNGTLRDVIRSGSSHRPSVAKQQFNSFIHEIFLGLEYLHIRHIIHRDLKPENILLDSHYHIKIADFGISIIHANYKSESSPVGTYLYMAPEVMHGKKFDFKSDIWSLGCTLYEMCYGYSPFQQAKSLTDLHYLIETLTKQGLKCKAITIYYGSVWSQICENMLTKELNRRISLKDVLSSCPTITITYYKKYLDYQY